MSKFHTYEEFLYEREVTVPTVTSMDQIVTTMIDSAKRQKLIKKGKMLSYKDDPDLKLITKAVDQRYVFYTFETNKTEDLFGKNEGKSFGVTFVNTTKYQRDKHDYFMQNFSVIDRKSVV